MIKEKSLHAKGVIAFYKCNSNDEDDILIFDENGTQINTLHVLRQQLN